MRDEIIQSAIASLYKSQAELLQQQVNDLRALGRLEGISPFVRLSLTEAVYSSNRPIFQRIGRDIALLEELVADDKQLDREEQEEAAASAKAAVDSMGRETVAMLDGQRLSPKELQFWALLMEQGANEISRRVSEDMAPEAYDLLNDHEKAVLAERFERWNSKGKDEPHFFPNAGIWLDFLAATFRQLAQQGEALAVTGGGQ